MSDISFAEWRDSIFKTTTGVKWVAAQEKVVRIHPIRARTLLGMEFESCAKNKQTPSQLLDQYLAKAKQSQGKLRQKMRFSLLRFEFIVGHLEDLELLDLDLLDLDLDLERSRENSLLLMLWL